MPERLKFDQSAFYAALDATRRQRGLTWKQVSEESGVSASTLARMSRGRGPDASGLAALVSWAELKLDDFVNKNNRIGGFEGNTIATVSAQFRADPNLTPEGADALTKLVAVSYAQLKKPPPR